MRSFIEINKVIRSFSAYKIHRRTIDMYHNCDTPNFPLGGVGNKKIRIFNYLL